MEPPVLIGLLSVSASLALIMPAPRPTPRAPLTTASASSAVLRPFFCVVMVLLLWLRHQSSCHSCDLVRECMRFASNSSLFFGRFCGWLHALRSGGSSSSFTCLVSLSLSISAWLVLTEDLIHHRVIQSQLAGFNWPFASSNKAQCVHLG